MGETRVNLRHLLEDIRDTYPFPVEEVILTELVANALDSGASEIGFTIDAGGPALTYRVVRPDGTAVTLVDEAQPVRDHEGTMYRVTGIVRVAEPS